MLKQPVPSVTQDDVERIVRRDFPEVQFSVVLSILNEYASARERHRVQLAAVKLAKGNLEELRSLELANQDFRDLLMAAEYPNYSQNASRIRNLPPEERGRIIDADWKQYQEWLGATPDVLGRSH